MAKFLRVAVALLTVQHVGLAACPVLQPGVKEYQAAQGVADYLAAAVVFQDQEQCRIGADELLSTGPRSAYAGGALPERGVCIAVAGSEFGGKLISGFKLDVPDKEQGYAIRVDGPRAAIVGHDAIGALYGAVTFRQMMADGGRVESAVVRDWPDLLDRGGVSFGRGLWMCTEGADAPGGRAEEVKRCIDELVRHKMNGITDIFLMRADSPSKKVCHEVFAYARSRGVRVTFSAPGGTGLWTNRNCPPGMTPRKWPCVTGVRGWGDIYYCWADDAEIEAAANRCIDYLMEFGLEDPVVSIHPVDSAHVEDPEEWSRRCAKCRARWKDDERWKASANLFNIWRRTFDRRLPQASFVTPAVPYSISLLKTPKGKRDARWRQNVTDYWTKLDAALDDHNMAFVSWIAPRQAFREYRQLLPDRAVNYCDTYPQSPGLFLTCRRKLGTMYEPGGKVGYHMTGTDVNARWESCLLAAEYAWDVHAPGWEEYDGAMYWHPVLDTTGPEIVMTNVLPRICRTFWGEELAPYMCRIMSSGVLPKYLQNPQESVREWNKVLRNANYDPAQAGSRAEGKKTGAAFVDSLVFRRSQLEAARKCEETFAAARPLAGRLQHFKRRYFESMADAAPGWVEQAAGLVASAEIDAALEANDIEKAHETARSVALGMRKGAPRSRLERLAEVLKARSDDSAVPPLEGRAGQSAPDMKDWRQAEVWQGEKIIDSPLVINRRNIRVMPGARIVFKGAGCLRLDHGQFRAEGAEFVGEGVLTNAWRIAISSSGMKVGFVNCRFEGLATHNPGGQRWFHGGMTLWGANIRIAGCHFIRTQSPTLVNSKGVEVSDNVFSCTDVDLYLLNCSDARVERNVFLADSGARNGMELANSPHSQIVHNRFCGLATGIFARTDASHIPVAGNVFTKCGRPLRTMGSKGVAIVDSATMALSAVRTASDVETSDYRVPYKLGLPIIAPSGTPGAFDQLAVDHPRLFVHDGRFYLSYLGYDGISYQTALAASDDLLHWERVGMVFTRNQSTNNWDRLGRVVSSYLTPCDFRKNPELTRYKGRYWLFYHAYPGKGYEVGAAANGIAWADSPASLEWHCLDKPVFTVNPESGHWDSGGLYSICAVPFKDSFLLYYNGKEAGFPWHEQMGIADPEDDSLTRWRRRPGGPAIPAGDLPWNANYTSGTPLYDSRHGRWMRYFMGFSNDIGHAYTGVGVSEDGIAWRHSPSPVLSPLADEIDETHAHKTAHAWLNGDLYLIYCAVRPLKGDAERAKFYKGQAWNEYRCLTIARSRPWTDAERASMR